MRSAATRVLTIDQALRWAYRDELPKMARSADADAPMANAWSAVTRYGETLATIDVSPNCFGVIPDLTAVSPPHPDAIAIAGAVDELAGLVLELAPDWRPFGDLGDLGALGEQAIARVVDAISTPAIEAGQPVRNLTFKLDELVRRFAVIKSPPDWTAERPMQRYESHGNGEPKWFRRVPYLDPVSGTWREQEVDGFDRKARRPQVGAYRKSFLDPDPTEAGIWRAEWQAWVTALEILAGGLAGMLETIDVRPCGHSLVPWEEARRGTLFEIALPGARPMTLAEGSWIALETRDLHKASARSATIFGVQLEAARRLRATRTEIERARRREQAWG